VGENVDTKLWWDEGWGIRDEVFGDEVIPPIFTLPIAISAWTRSD
jgi:hypothetical protein